MLTRTFGKKDKCKQSSKKKKMKEPRKVVTRKFKNAGIPSIKIPLNIARRNR